jgi:hypothetical protein
MKATMIVVIILLCVIAIAQMYISRSTSETEQHKYIVLKTYPEFEVRKYEPALFSSVKLGSKGYKQSSSEGFQILAGYIFGGNESNEQIAMTSPVAMELGDSSRMMFMIPKSRDFENLPNPKDSKIVFEKQEEKIVAAIRFDGWADDKKIESYTSILKEELARQNIAHTNKFIFLGYNPPFEVINRRNEVIVELINFK